MRGSKKVRFIKEQEAKALLSGINKAPLIGQLISQLQLKML